MAFSNLLVAIDGSKHSLRSLRMAITIAKPTGAKITIVHATNVQSNNEFHHADTGVHDPEEISRIVQDAEEVIQKSGVPFTSKVVSGNTGYHIVKLAHSKSPKFDMVILGSRGRGSIKEMFFGSTSNYVIHSSKIPVLVVK